MHLQPYSKQDKLANVALNLKYTFFIAKHLSGINPMANIVP